MVYIKRIGDTKHIFSHKEWHMTGYAVRVDELERPKKPEFSQDWIFIDRQEAREHYAIPSAYAFYAKYLDIQLGVEKQ